MIVRLDRIPSLSNACTIFTGSRIRLPTHWAIGLSAPLRLHQQDGWVRLAHLLNGKETLFLRIL